MTAAAETTGTGDAATQAVVMRGITKRFPGVVALADVTLEVRRGEIHAICGENGAGKSTLMKILSGVYQPDDGVLEIGGRAVRFAGTRDAERAGIAIIHQELALVEDLSVAANVFLGREKRTALGLLVHFPPAVTSPSPASALGLPVHFDLALKAVFYFRPLVPRTAVEGQLFTRDSLCHVTCTSATH